MAKKKTKKKLSRKQAQLVQQTQENVKRFVELGLNEAIVPPDIPGWLVRLVYAQRLIAEEKYKDLAGILCGEAETLGWKADEIKLLRKALQLADERKDNPAWHDLAALILNTIHGQWKNYSAQQKWAEYK